MLGVAFLHLSACTGIMSGIYDEAENASDYVLRGDTIQGTLYVNAHACEEWRYVDLHAIRDAAVSANRLGEVIKLAEWDYPRIAIPTTLTGEWDGVSRIDTFQFKVLTGEGLHDNHFVSSVKCDPQPDPASWDFALHYCNARTNGGEAMEVGVDKAYVADSLTRNEVWSSLSTILTENVPCQVISTNAVMSRWVTMHMPPIPPSFTHHAGEMVLRMKDGTCAWLKCTDYLSTDGYNRRCCFTIQFIYPYSPSRSRMQ